MSWPSTYISASAKGEHPWQQSGVPAIVAYLLAAPSGAAMSLFALSDQVALAVVAGMFGFLSTSSAAMFTWLARREARKERRESREWRGRIERKVDAPRAISTTREEGVRVEPPEVPE